MTFTADTRFSVTKLRLSPFKARAALVSLCIVRYLAAPHEKPAV